MASVESSASNGTAAAIGSELSAAQRLQQRHDEAAHNATIEDVVDEDEMRHGENPDTFVGVLEGPGDTPAPGWMPPVSAKAAGKRKVDNVSAPSQPLIDTQSEESFPGLGGSKPKQPTSNTPLWKVGRSANGTNGTLMNGTASPASGVATPQTAKSAASSWGAANSGLKIPGQHQEPYHLRTNEMLPKSQQKKPIPDLLKDVNKRSKANVAFKSSQDGITFIATGPREAAIQAIRDVVANVGAKISIQMPIPGACKAFIIGKQGSMIKQLQEKTGARIQIPKSDDSRSAADDDESMIDISVEGNALSVAEAQKEINKIVDERTPPVNAKLRSIPAEYYPFIAGNPSINEMEEKQGVRVQVPSYHTWTSQPPPRKPTEGQAPTFKPAADDNHITLSGERAAVQAARTEIERLAQQLERQLAIDELNVERSRHQFIIGKPGMKPHDFFAQTGCAIIFPGDEDEEMITIVGPSDRTQAARQKAMQLAGEMQNSRFDILKAHRNIPGGGSEHARNITEYLRQRKAIEKLEELHQAHIVAALSQNGTVAPWDVYSRSFENVSNAKSAISDIVSAHPPSRFASIDVDPFYHKYLRDGITPVVKRDFGVHVVTPGDEADTAVLLVFEGDAGLNPHYEVPRGAPSAAEIQAFEQALVTAQKHILDIISSQAEIKSTSIDVPKLFHEKLRRFIKREQAERSQDEIPVRVLASGTVVTLKGPAPAVDSLATKVNAFVKQAIEDDKERDFTLTFDFPQKHTNQLIGKGGNNIHELRDRFDVEIQVEDGKVELKGPKAKAEAARNHITNLGKQWADETTYVLKIEPKYHRELIGSQGNVINKLQTRYNVQIHFPRSARNARDDQSNADAASEVGSRRPRREQEPDEVIIKGPKKGADGARDEMLELLQYNKDNNFASTISVQQSQIPSLIGQRGREMDLLREQTGARIDVPNAKDINDGTGRVDIQVRGTKTQVAQAMKLLEEKKTIFDQTVVEYLEVDRNYHSSLIGSGGSALRDLVVKAGGSDDRRELARTIQFPKNGSEGNTIKIEGKSDIVEKIIASIRQIVSEKESQTTQTIEVPAEKHRSLIGRGGEVKKSLEAKFRVSIDIPRQGSGETGVRVTGQPSGVEDAKSHISELIKGQEGETVQVPCKIHHKISDNGSFFRKLRNEHKVRVDHGGHRIPPKPAAIGNTRANGGALPLITDEVDTSANTHSWSVVSVDDSDIPGEIPWILQGSPENIAKAKDVLSAAMEQALQNTTTGYLVLPDPRTYRFVIGQGGRQVNSIRAATGCKITVPRDQAHGEAIEVSGTADGVEQAKVLILQAVEEGRSDPGSRN